MVFGTFDIFHRGHQSFLEQAKKYGDYLIVVIARDKTVLALKKYQTQNSEQKRREVVEKSGLAKAVELGKDLGKDGIMKRYDLIKKHQPDIICLGYDQEFFVDNLKRDLKQIGMGEIKIIKLKPYKPEIYKSSKLKNNK